MGLEKASLSNEYFLALSYAPWEVPKDNAPMVILPPVKVCKNCLNPYEGEPSNAFFDTFISSK